MDLSEEMPSVKERIQSHLSVVLKVGSLPLGGSRAQSSAAQTSHCVSGSLNSPVMNRDCLML